MDIVENKVYSDRRGVDWRVTSIGTGRTPVVAHRVNNCSCPVCSRQPHCRLFLRDGSYGLHEPFDLVEEVRRA